MDNAHRKEILWEERKNLFSSTDILCELWDEEQVATSSHSRLYHLEPIGVGTPLVESLTSYIARLACAHSVHPNVLVAQALVPLLGVPTQGRQPYAQRTSFWAGSVVLNGATPFTTRLVQALEVLTRRTDLCFLTMLTWKEVLSHHQIARRLRAWCPACLEEWRETSQVVYEPLLWALEGVHRCPMHGYLLQTTCPNPRCARRQSPLSPRSQPGFCAHCNRWLGIKLISGTEPTCVPEEELRWHQWVEIAVGELVAAAPTLTTSPHRDCIAASVKKVMNGNQLALARRLQITQTSVWQWLEGVRIPQLKTLLQVCFRLGISPVSFLTGAIEEISTPSHLEDHRSPQPRKRPYKRFDVEGIQQTLEAVLHSTEEPPPSMSEVTRRLGYDQALFRKYFPEVCRAISKKYLDYLAKKRHERIQKLCEEVHQATLTLHAQGCYPGNRQVAKLLSKPTSFMEPEVQLTWRQTVRELGVKPMR